MNVTFKKLIRNNKFIYGLCYPLIKLREVYFDYLSWRFDNFFSNVVEGSIVVTVKNIPGEYEIDARSHILRSIFISHDYEPSIVDLIKKNTATNKDSINIGANIGLYSNLLATLIDHNKKLLAIEPTPNAFKYLKANIERNNNVDKIITYNGIASDVPGMFKINIIQGKEEYSSIGEIVHSSVEGQKHLKIDVEGDTVDHLVEKYKLQPGIIVIDVEGAEFKVLSGAINTIHKYKPIIISELNDKLLEKLNSSSTEIIQLLEDNGYKVKDVKNNKLTFPFIGNIIAS